VKKKSLKYKIETNDNITEEYTTVADEFENGNHILVIPYQSAFF